MSLKMRLMRVAGLLGLFLAVGFLLPKLGPQAPDSYQGVAAPTTTTTTATAVPPSTRTTIASKPPPGFPSFTVLNFATESRRQAPGSPAGSGRADCGVGISRQTEITFRQAPDDDAVIQDSEPIDLQINSAPAVRYTVTASNLLRKYDCDPPAASIDIVAMQGYSNATVAVFMVLSGQQTDGSLSRETIDGIIASLRRTPGN